MEEQTEEFYETPSLVEVGEFSEDTLGYKGSIWDNFLMYNT
ncbi:lasso RiPP family leader peptide-containing protein [Streptomyces sp. NPDC058682]|nr:lasso RiPP family leader peptide-containing protein [Streptomyces sp. NBC_01214]MCX4805307.1 lasso RiPP family leader peptide-containing protein [Streptomyces sp. NBC_01214]